MSSALTRYRLMAMIVGTMLLVLVLVGIPLQYGADEATLANVVAPIHGILYMIYLLTVLDLWRREHLTLRQVAAMVGAGFVPFLAFFIERRITRQLRDSGHGLVRDSGDGLAAGVGSASATPATSQQPAGDALTPEASRGG